MMASDTNVGAALKILNDKIKALNKCQSCGKFRKRSDIFFVAGEGGEEWSECFYCCSQNDRETYFKTKDRE